MGDFWCPFKDFVAAIRCCRSTSRQAACLLRRGHRPRKRRGPDAGPGLIEAILRGDEPEGISLRQLNTAALLSRKSFVLVAGTGRGTAISPLITFSVAAEIANLALPY